MQQISSISDEVKKKHGSFIQAIKDAAVANRLATVAEHECLTTGKLTARIRVTVTRLK